MNNRIGILVLIMLSGSIASFAQEEPKEIKQTLAPNQSLDDFCKRTFLDSAVCPEDACHQKCNPKANDEPCELSCVPKPCIDLPADMCPEKNCRVLLGCGGEHICFPKLDRDPPTCGTLGYDGQAAECCEGLVKRCGVEFVDGTCDMIGEQSMYGVPICLPCGNGICNQFENRCNCPEDCLD